MASEGENKVILLLMMACVPLITPGEWKSFQAFHDADVGLESELTIVPENPHYNEEVSCFVNETEPAEDSIVQWMVDAEPLLNESSRTLDLAEWLIPADSAVSCLIMIDDVALESKQIVVRTPDCSQGECQRNASACSAENYPEGELELAIEFYQNEAQLFFSVYASDPDDEFEDCLSVFFNRQLVGSQGFGLRIHHFISKT